MSIGSPTEIHFAKLLTLSLAGKRVTYKDDGLEYTIAEVFVTGYVRIVPSDPHQYRGQYRNGLQTTPDQMIPA